MTFRLDRGTAKLRRQVLPDCPDGPYGRRCQSQRNVYLVCRLLLEKKKAAGRGSSVCHRRRGQDIQCGEKTPWPAPSKRAEARLCDSSYQISRAICPEHSASSPNAPSPMPARCSDADLFVEVAWRLPSHCYIDGNDCGHDREAPQSISPYAPAHLKNSCPRHRCLRSTRAAALSWERCRNREKRSCRPWNGR